MPWTVGVTLFTVNIIIWSGYIFSNVYSTLEYFPWKFAVIINGVMVWEALDSDRVDSKDAKGR